jgi:hypothetical protein
MIATCLLSGGTVIKNLSVRKEAQPLPASDLYRERSIGSKIRQLFRPEHKLGSSIGILYRIQSFFSNLGRSRDRAEEASRKAMDTLRKKDPGLEPLRNVKDPVRGHPTAFKQIDPLPEFRPAYLPMSATDLCDMVIKFLPEKDQNSEYRLKIQTHIMAADRIHTSVLETFQYNGIDRALPLGEGNKPESVLKTLDELAKLTLDRESTSSIEVLQQSVSDYQQRLRR